MIFCGRHRIQTSPCTIVAHTATTTTTAPIGNLFRPSTGLLVNCMVLQPQKHGSKTVPGAKITLAHHPVAENQARK